MLTRFSWKHRALTAIATTIPIAVWTVPKAHAVTFNFSYAPGTTAEQMLVVETAGRMWSSYLTDETEINLYIEMTNALPDRVIGGALPGVQAKERFGDVYKALRADAASDTDWQAVNTMAVDGKYNRQLRGIIDNTFTGGINSVNLTSANAKALGLGDTNDDSRLDGVILMNDLTSASGISWNYDVTQNPGENQLDFLSVIMHEIGHNLGFVSIVDTQDAVLDDPWRSSGWLFETGYYGHGSFYGYNYNYSYNYFNNSSQYQAYLLDAFRYTSNSQIAGKNFIDLSRSEDAYFSVDGGATRNCEMSAGTSVDSFQGSHWEQRDGDVIGIMDPMLDLGQRRSVKDCDLMALNVIGWDIADDAPILDLADLYDQSLMDLGDVLGIELPTLADLIAREEDLTANRLADVGKMIQDSKVYEWTASGWWQNGKINSVYEWTASGWWQESDILQYMRWQTLDQSAVNRADAEGFKLVAHQAKSTAVPEPISVLGFVGMIMASWRLRHKRF
ncbi:MAG: NF038122 family metalloprotease [Thainema sp.]